jgi:sugar phosphate permease
LIGLSVLAPALRDDLGLSLNEIGAVFASVNLGLVLGLLPFGVATDRRGERLVVTLGLVGAAAALMAAAFVGGFWPLFAFLVLAGFLGSGVNSGTGRAVLRWFSREQRGLALGVRQTAIPIGGAVAAGVLPVLADAGGVRAGLLALAGASLAGAVAGLALRDSPHGDDADPELVEGALRDSRLLWLSAGSSLILVGQVAIVGFVVLFLHEERGVSPAAAAGILAAIQVGGAALRVVTGVWSDRVGDRLGPLRQVAVGLAIALGLTTALTGSPLVVLVPAFIVAGTLSMGWNALAFVAAAELGGRRHSGAAIGVQQTALAVSAAAASVAFAAVASLSWPFAFAAAAACPLAGAALLGRG